MQEIRHKARIVQVHKDSIDLEIEVQSACAQCALQKACQMHEVSQRKITIPIQSAKEYKQGDDVYVAIALEDGFRAMFYAYILPLILVLLTLCLCLIGEMSEFISGICSIIVLIPYYFGVFLKKNFFAKKLHFRIVDKS